MALGLQMGLAGGGAGGGPIYGLWLDGVDDVGTLDSPTLPTTGNWELKFRMTAAAGWTPGANTYGIGQRSSGGNQMMVGVDSVGTTVRLLVGAQPVPTIAGLVRGTEYECSITRVGDLFTLTVDGLGTAAATSAGHTMSNADTAIGLVTGTSYWKGVFRDLRSYNSAGTLIGQWLIDGNLDADAEDQVGSNDMTLAGSPDLAVSSDGGATWIQAALLTAMLLTGFDPAEAGSEWALIATDIHFAADASKHSQQWTELAPTMVDVLDTLGPVPPDRVVIMGDIMTDFVSSFGIAKNVGYTVYGDDESAWWNADAHHFTDLAPVTIILGNHDTPRNETPSFGSYALANLDGFDSLNSSFTLGGTKWICISNDHGAAWLDGQDTYYAARMAEVTTEEVVVCMHQPGGGRAKDWHGFRTMLTTTPAISNEAWMFCGHAHQFQDYVFEYGYGSSLVVALCGAGIEWPTFGDDSNPALTAVCCRGGEVVARFKCECDDGAWVAITEPSRATPSAVTAYYAPIDDSYTRLASYNGESHDLTTFAQNEETSGGTGRWRYTGSWFSYMYNCHLAFPLPATATKFFACLTAVPDTVEFSADGVDWTDAGALPALSDSFLVLDIPAPLQGGSDLHIRIVDATELHGSGFGFIS
jgi:hypothetical protein